MLVWLLIGVASFTATLFVKYKSISLLLALGSFALFFNLPTGDILTYLLMCLGFLLVYLEVYLPVFGISGILGLAAIVMSIYMETNSTVNTFLILLSMIITSGITFVIFLKLGKEISINPQLILQSKSTQPSQDSSSLNKHSGELLNQVAFAYTDLKPVGKIVLDQEILEVMSESEWITKGEKVRIIKLQGQKIIVRKEV